ncbi:MAG: class I SAM-dependent methyltransferase [Luteolibacter sp.]
MNDICKICGSRSIPLAKAVIRGKYEIQYFSCSQCDFIQTEEPYWLEEAYQSPINPTDIGYISRNISLSNITYSLLRGPFHQARRFIDYGGGYGMFARIMRDKGIDFRWQDEYCENLFAIGFEAHRDTNRNYDVLTSFEVFEHLLRPAEELEKMLRYAPVVIFSTLLIPFPKISPPDWWYYGLEHGQHISLFSDRSLDALADKYSLFRYSIGTSLHIFSAKPISRFLFRIFRNSEVVKMVNLLMRRPSLLDADFQKIRAEITADFTK